MNSPQSRLAMLVIVWLAAGAISVAAQSVNVPPGQSGPVGSQGMSPPVSGNFGVTPQPGTAMTPGYAPGTAAPSVGSGAGPGLSSGAPFSGTGYGTSALGRTSPDAAGTLPSVPPQSPLSVAPGGAGAGGRTTNSSSAGSSPGAGSPGPSMGTTPSSGSMAPGVGAGGGR